MFLFNAYLGERNFLTVNTCYFIKTIKTSAKNRVASKSEKYSAFYLRMRIEEQESESILNNLQKIIQINLRLMERAI